MLVIRFSVAVAKEHVEEVQTKLHNDFGVNIIKSLISNERVYIDCCVPYDRFEYVTAWLHFDFKGNALLTY